MTDEQFEKWFADIERSDNALSPSFFTGAKAGWQACAALAQKRIAELEAALSAGQQPVAAPSMPQISDSELLRRCVRSVVRRRKPKTLVAWSAVSDVFGLGSTFSAQLCRRFGLHPDTGSDLPAPVPTSQT